MGARRYRQRRTSATPDALAPAMFAPPTAASPESSGADAGVAAGRPLPPAALLTRRRQRAPGAWPGGGLGPRFDQGPDRGSLGLHVDPQTEFGGGLGGLGSDAGDDRPRVRLAGDADQVAHRRARREAHRVKTTGLDHFPRGGRRRRGAHRPVGGDVLDLPATFAQPLGP